MKTNRNAFTLIELLVVIAIIGILAAMIFPAINKALQQAKISKARQEALSIAAAIDMYWNDYGQLPVPLTAAEQGLSTGTQGNINSYPEQDSKFFTDDRAKKIIQVLIAEPSGDNSGHALNPKRKVYLSMEAAKSTGELLDPWGTQYRIKLDRDYDNKLEYYNMPDQHRKRSIVVSAGPDRQFPDNNGNSKFAKDNVANVTLINIPK
jgi:prepilin-type N-terminal cleavage/methylation domain-containing protein